VRGLVDLVIAEESLNSRNRAYGRLEERGWLSYEGARRLDLQARQESRFRAHISLDEKAANRVSGQEMPTAFETLRPGGAIKRRGFNSALGPIDIAFSAVE